MKISSIWLFCIGILALIVSPVALAHEEAEHTLAATVKVKGELKVGAATPITLVLTRISEDKRELPKDLKVVHTRRVHLLIVDPSLTDYQHIHPTATKNGEWSFSFTPKKEGSYRIWVDGTPIATNTREYLKVDIGNPLKKLPDIDKTTNNIVTLEGYTFGLHFDGPLKAGKASMGQFTVRDRSGQPIAKLEPVMGAFAHIVGFGEDYNSVLHVHPLGEEPTEDSQRGGPNLEFHVEPEKAGFVKLFVQTKIDGKDIFAPFGVMVK